MTLSDRMEFDHVIRVRRDGTVVDEPGVYAPEVSMSEDLTIDIYAGWELLNGYSGQDRYAGPVMHPSEFIGGGMERDILSTPGVYVAVVVTMLDNDSDDGEDNVAGWAVARKVPESGYTNCACRDCFDIAVSNDVTMPDLCGLCEAAACDVDGESGCERSDS